MDNKLRNKIIKYCQNKKKNGLNSNGNADPYVTPLMISKKFKIVICAALYYLSQIDSPLNNYILWGDTM